MTKRLTRYRDRIRGASRHYQHERPGDALFTLGAAAELARVERNKRERVLDGSARRWRRRELWATSLADWLKNMSNE